MGAMSPNDLLWYFRLNICINNRKRYMRPPKSHSDDSQTRHYSQTFITRGVFLRHYTKGICFAYIKTKLPSPFGYKTTPTTINFLSISRLCLLSPSVSQTGSLVNKHNGVRLKPAHVTSGRYFKTLRLLI